MNRYLLLFLLFPIFLVPVYAQSVDLESLYEGHSIITNFMISNNGNLVALENSEQLDLPVFATFVNATSNELIIGLDYKHADQSKEFYSSQIESLIENTPYSIKYGVFIRESSVCNFQNEFCTPVIGGIAIDGDGILPYDGTLTLPVERNDGSVGILTAGHLFGIDQKVFQANKEIIIVK